MSDIRSYKDLTCELCGEDTSPAENGNMLTFKRYTPALGEIANIIVTREPVDGLELMGTAEGVNVYRTGTHPKPQKTPKLPSETLPLILALGALAASVLCALGGKK